MPKVSPIRLIGPLERRGLVADPRSVHLKSARVRTPTNRLGACRGNHAAFVITARSGWGGHLAGNVLQSTLLWGNLFKGSFRKTCICASGGSWASPIPTPKNWFLWQDAE